MSRCHLSACLGPLLVTLLLAAMATTPVPAVTAQGGASPTPAPGPGLCAVSGTQAALADEVERGQPLTVRLTLRAECPDDVRGRADIMLVVDHSASMADDDKATAAAAAVELFVAQVDLGRHRLGLVPFEDTAWVAQPLTDRPDRVLGALERLDAPSGGTNIASALAMADGELEITGRREAVEVIVLLTDGQSSEGPMLEAAAAARARGTVIFTIGLGPDAVGAALSRVATTAEHYYEAPGPADLDQVYEQIAAIIRTFAVTDVALASRLAPSVVHVAEPPAFTPSGDGGARDWWFAFVPAADGLTVEYDVRIYRTGLIRPVETAWAEYADGDGVRRRFTFPPGPAVRVVPPQQRSIYLPTVWQDHCAPATHGSDVVLALDVSDSMRGQKLDQAVSAAKTFVGLLDLQRDTAAVVAYDAEARLAQPLTSDAGALLAALDGLTSGSGTRLDRGLIEAAFELVGARATPGNRPAIVLLSDGKQVEAPETVGAAARFARGFGITVYTIALGADADRALLRSVADDPSQAYYAPGPADLARIYTEVAGAVGCR